MNHGILFPPDDPILAELWYMAMEKGEFVAIYTNQSMKHRSDDWRSIVSEQPGSTFRYPDVPSDYPDDGNTCAKFEPQYDGQFVKMFWEALGHESLLLPANATAEAQRLLADLNAVQTEAYWRLRRALVPARYRSMEPKKGPRKVRDLFRPIRLGFGWACFPDVYHPNVPKALFLSESEADVSRLAERCASESDQVIERW